MKHDVHLPPPAVWREAQARAKACGLRIDMTADGIFHFYRLCDGQEHNSRDDWAGALELLTHTEAERARTAQLVMELS